MLASFYHRKSIFLLRFPFDSPWKKKQLIVFYHLHMFHIFTSNCNFPGCSEIWAIGPCSAGVLLMRANVKSSRSFIWSAMFDLQLEWTVGAGGWGRGKGESLPHINPSPYFWPSTAPLVAPCYNFISLPSQIKDGSHNIRQNYAS